MKLGLHNPVARRWIAGAVIAVLLLLALVIVLAWGRSTDTRHRPFVFDEAFDFTSGSFADYLAWSERRLRAARPDADADVLAALAPFRLEPAPGCAPGTAAFRNGVVLTHDLLDSPYHMRALGEYFQSRCFLVYALLLPGHGTQPGDLLDASWRDWAAAEAFAARELEREADNVYLAGHGVGGTLAILEAAGNAGIDGLVLFAPQLGTRAGGWRAKAGAMFGWLVPGARWERIVPAYTPYRYESAPYRMRAESSALVAATLDALPRRPFEVPVFTVLGLDDVVSDPARTLAYMDERVHPLSYTLLYGRETPAQLRPNQSFINTLLPEVGMRGLSHLGLTVPPEDPEFGYDGASHDCGHYYRSDADAYAACMAGERNFQGEITAENLAADGVLERSDFNLFFYETLTLMDGFFAPVVRVQSPMSR